MIWNNGHRPADATLAARRLIARDSETLKETLMWDVIMLAIGLGLFALSIGYAYACDRL